MPETDFFGFAPIERVALDAIEEERPEILSALQDRLTPVLDDLVQTCQGLVTSEWEADDLLDRLRDEFVGRMMAEMEPWGEEEDLRGTVVDLLTRHLLAEARAGLGSVLGATWN